MKDKTMKRTYVLTKGKKRKTIKFGFIISDCKLSDNIDGILDKAKIKFGYFDDYGDRREFIGIPISLDGSKEKMFAAMEIRYYVQRGYDVDIV